jgi:cytidylate kinase
LSIAPDAIVIDTTTMSIDEVVEQVQSIVDAVLKGAK